MYSARGKGSKLHKQHVPEGVNASLYDERIVTRVSSLSMALNTEDPLARNVNRTAERYNLIFSHLVFWSMRYLDIFLQKFVCSYHLFSLPEKFDSAYIRPFLTILARGKITIPVSELEKLAEKYSDIGILGSIEFVRGWTRGRYNGFDENLQTMERITIDIELSDRPLLQRLFASEQIIRLYPYFCQEYGFEAFLDYVNANDINSSCLIGAAVTLLITMINRKLTDTVHRSMVERAVYMDTGNFNSKTLDNTRVYIKMLVSKYHGRYNVEFTEPELTFLAESGRNIKFVSNICYMKDRVNKALWWYRQTCNRENRPFDPVPKPKLLNRACPIYPSVFTEIVAKANGVAMRTITTAHDSSNHTFSVYQLSGLKVAVTNKHVIDKIEAAKATERVTDEKKEADEAAKVAEAAATNDDIATSE